MVIGLGITWILDGLEVTIVGAIGPRLQQSTGLGLTAREIGEAATAYLIGAALGALVFGDLTDRFGRKRLFLITLAVYAVTTLATALSWNFMSFAVCRALAGTGIGGEYAAINSAIDELIPSRQRGRVDLGINATWWLGTIFGASATFVLLDPRLIDPRIGWRLAFALGAIIAIGILFVRRSLPESPRWLVLHGREHEASRVVDGIEQHVARTATIPPLSPERFLRYDPAQKRGFAAVFRTMLLNYPNRTFVALSLMISQAFLYNAIFFTEALVLGTFYHVPPERIPIYIFPFAAGNLAGPFLLGPLFDIVGRKLMIAATYALSGVLLALTGWAFVTGILSAETLTAAWCVVFFFASAGASAAYLTVSETFPAAMIAAACVELNFGVEAARRMLEEISD